MPFQTKKLFIPVYEFDFNFKYKKFAQDYDKLPKLKKSKVEINTEGHVEQQKKHSH